MADFLPPSPPIPRNPNQQQTAYTNATFWSDWYEKLRTIINTINTSLVGFVTTASANLPAGYAALDGAARINAGVDTTDDVIVDDINNGLVLKSPAGDYWRVTIDNAGVLIRTNLGPTKP